MKAFKHSLKSYFFTIGVLTSTFFTNNGFSEPYLNHSDGCGQFYIAAELLYWKPMHDPIFWSRLSNRPNSGTPPFERQEFYLTGTWDPGVRVHLGYETPCWFIDLAYLYFCNREKDHVGIGGFDKLEIQGSPPFISSETEIEAKASAKFLYQNVDGRFGYNFYSCCKKSLFVYGNVRWVKIDFRNLTQGMFEGTTTFGDYFDQHMQFNGGGFGLGIGGHSSLFCRLGLNGHVGIMGIVGETFIKKLGDNNASRNPGPFFLTSSESWWHIIPAFDFQLSLDYGICLCNVNVNFEVGYEFNYYLNVLRFTSRNQMPGTDSERIPPIDTQTLGFGGPFFKLTVLY